MLISINYAKAAFEDLGLALPGCRCSVRPVTFYSEIKHRGGAGPVSRDQGAVYLLQESLSALHYSCQQRHFPPGNLTREAERFFNLPGSLAFWSFVRMHLASFSPYRHTYSERKKTHFSYREQKHDGTDTGGLRLTDGLLGCEDKAPVSAEAAFGQGMHA